ncbi:VanW family protein [Lederbergia wuyishanensis]|uniref:Vancomycin resistance protein YoaR n=1 Tax=Lederbergia wuyishanensis TaxID=1347903 RepID=A0ABU0D7Q4_9BACI|nr:VanW family protein [Lederbergia wuyishanensis]MCJ8009099.1 VanW family protein [Lederbergia wuyishanensis]MDQ0344437.1 vancomycin resistance protein YoaR [Lederbergia wuyishanensis]
MYKGVLTIILVSSLLGLTGCSVQAAKQKELDEKIAELDKQKQMYEEEQKKLEEERKKAEELRLEEERIKAEELKPIDIEVVDPLKNEVIKTFNYIRKDLKENEETYKQEIQNWARELARGTDTTEGYDQRMIPDRLGEDGKIIKGSPRVILEEAELVEKIVAAFDEGGTVELPLQVTESAYKEIEASQLDEVVVATFTTYFGGSPDGRNKNIELSADAINNVILGIDDYFSFNTTVGPSDAEHGYQKAMEALNGKLVEGIGGGICQTSSTLFNAVDQIAVSYVELHHHSVNVGYVPKGRDATVSYGGKDFRFQNKAGAPLLIKAFIKGGALTVELRTSKENQDFIKKGNA